MKNKDNRPAAAAELHRRAEKKAKADEAKIRVTLSPKDAQQALHELRVHQIELEMQNEELRRVQAELEAARARYSDLYDLAPVGYFMLSEKGLILEANLTAATMLGEKKAALVKKPITRFILPEDQDIYCRHRKPLFETGAPQICELRMAREDGAFFWARVEATAAQGADGGPVCRAVISDITERKRAEQNQVRLEAMLDATPGFVGFADAKDTHLLYINPAGRKMVGIQAQDDVTQLKIADVHPEWTNRLFRDESIPTAIRDGMWTGECAFLNRDGHEIPVMMALLAHKSPSGEVERFSTISIDITERKRAELLERTVYEIARAPETAKSLDDLYHSIHLIIKGLMPAANFLIALYDENKNLVSFPYFVDEVDLAPPSRKLGKGLTDYVLRTGNTLLCDAALEKDLSRRGEVERIGTLSSCWLGVPLKARDKTIGVIALDNYSDPKAYGERERKVLEYVSGQVANAIERKRAEETLQESLERLNLANRATFNAIWDWNLQTDALLWNENFQTLFGYRAEEIEPGIESWTNRIHPEDLDRVKTGIHAAIDLEQDHWFDQYRFRRKDGMYADVEDRGYIARDACGQPVRMIGAMQDITERIRSEKAIQASLREKEILLREIHHRVKNNMQIISSLFNLQSGHIKDENARQMFKEGQLRIRSMALIHEKLYQSRDLSKIDFADYLRSLAEYLFQFFRVNADRIRLETDLEDVSLDVNSAVPCGLLVSELITNALKHAFPGDRKGVVRIGLRREEPGIVELRVADDGVGFPEAVDFRRTESLGLQIVSLLVGQIEGTIELDRKTGTAFTIAFRELGYKART